MTVKLGMVGTYINNHNFDRLLDVPAEVALKLVQHYKPEATLGGNIAAKDMEVDKINEQWINKFFVIITMQHEKWIAVYNHDGVFSIRTRKFQEGDEIYSFS